MDAETANAVGNQVGVLPAEVEDDDAQVYTCPFKLPHEMGATFV